MSHNLQFMTPRSAIQVMRDMVEQKRKKLQAMERALQEFEAANDDSDEPVLPQAPRLVSRTTARVPVDGKPKTVADCVEALIVAEGRPLTVAELVDLLKSRYHKKTTTKNLANT